LRVVNLTKWRKVYWSGAVLYVVAFSVCVFAHWGKTAWFVLSPLWIVFAFIMRSKRPTDIVPPR
jgi:hypothetical protein